MQSAPRPAVVPAEAKAPAQDAEIIPLVDSGARERWRRRLLIGLAVFILAAGGAYGARWYMVGRFLETTDDAYLQADSAVVAPKIMGYIAEVLVAGQQLPAGPHRPHEPCVAVGTPQAAAVAHLCSAASSTK